MKGNYCHEMKSIRCPFFIENIRIIFAECCLKENYLNGMRRKDIQGMISSLLLHDKFRLKEKKGKKL